LNRPRQLLQLLVATGCLVSPSLMARQLELPQAGGLLSLAALATLVISARLGWRQALLGSTGLALLTIPAVLSQGHPLAATLVLALAAGGLGVSARWQLQPVYWLLMVSLCMALLTLQLPSPPPPNALARLVGLLLVCGSSSGLVQGLLLPTAASGHEIFRVHHSWRRSLAYGLLLALSTLITVPIALAHHWHMSGLWLILTPFLVLRPFVKDAWRGALHRALGTVAGVLLVVVLALTLPAAWPPQLPGIALGATTALIAARHGHPALMLMGLTATIVLFDSSSADLVLMADKRLLASALGIAVTLALMAVAHPLEQRLIRRRRG